uniref:Putative secreted protein 94 n=1 Tax=Amblyomma triste TaxID=251400 RepID=A0A023GB07_AMBTT
MLLLPLLIVGFGVCSTESKNVPVPQAPTNKTLIVGTRKLMRSNETIRLLMYSNSIEGEIPKCISSNLLTEKQVGGGFRRTLEADGNITADSGKPIKPMKTSTTAPPKMHKISVRANVTVYVGQVYPTLQVKPDEDKLPPLWKDVQYILHAADKCIILAAGSYNGDPDKPPCTLWGYEKQTKCEQKFQNLCGNGVSVDLSECERLKKEGDSPVEN